jgi:hypothetical protein
MRGTDPSTPCLIPERELVTSSCRRYSRELETTGLFSPPGKVLLQRDSPETCPGAWFYRLCVDGSSQLRQTTPLVGTALLSKHCRMESCIPVFHLLYYFGGLPEETCCAARCMSSTTSQMCYTTEVARDALCCVYSSIADNLVY